MANILIIEDEPHLAEGLRFNLELEGYQVSTKMSAEEALPLYSQHDLIVLDLMLPGMSGIDFLHHIRQHGFHKPVLILSARTAEEDLIEGLSAGADDYVKKPFSLSELLLRIRRILERLSWSPQKSGSPAPYEFNGYWINFDSLQANTNQGLISLTQYECYLMKYLIENKGRSISRDELLREVWGYSESTPETRTVDIFIARMRKLFEKDTRNPRHILSVRGVGYRFED